MKKFISLICLCVCLTIPVNAENITPIESDLLRPSALALYWPLIDNLKPRIACGRNAVSFYRASAATYMDPNDGLIKTAAIDTPRFEANGLLVEAQKTNKSIYSEQFNQSGSGCWGNDPKRVSLSTNQVIAPDGNQTAEKLIEDTTAANNHYIYQLINTITSNVRVVFSLYAKPAERTEIALRFRDKNDVYTMAFFNLATGSLGSASGTNYISHSISPAANGFYRCVLIGNINSGAIVPQFFIYLVKNSTVVYNGDGSSGFYIWGAQVEEGYGPTSYISTTASAVTRAADTGYPRVQLPFNFENSQGTLYCEWTPKFSAVPDDTNLGILSLTNDPANLIYLRSTAGAASICSNDGVNTISESVTLTPGTINKIGLRWNAATGKNQLVVNGSAAAEGTYDGGYVTTGDLIYLSHTATNAANIKNLKLWKTDKGQAFLEGRTK